MYITDISNYYSEEQLQNYILNMNAFEVLQNINSAICDMGGKRKMDGSKLVYRQITTFCYLRFMKRRIY